MPLTRSSRARPMAGLLTSILLFGSSPTLADQDPLSQSMNISLDKNRREAEAQHRIDKLDDETRAMLDEYQRLSRELDVLTVYDGQLERLVASQEQEKTSIRDQMTHLEQTKREVVPLMLGMLQWLEQLIEADRPFLQEERQTRLRQLSELMDRADVSVGEKFRRVLEAYQIEMAYSRTIEAYRGELHNGDDVRTVDFLRVGRVGLYYQTLDRNEVGHWDENQGRWTSLPDEYSRPIRKGLRVARKQSAPELLHLPVALPEEIQP
ncbi:DUF3450 domain-containing protein [Thiohalomonas denitrificans]|uniref:DUF3450 domain-containing protein n=1 Tax=Thiohalomonas denitrificans TaxID=415747 RepID=UPI0026E9E4B3|nr:DUF3450 domain-containing protein [Thiohalomonas denitrificans]